MSTAARIDELRKKFESNPRRYFAPLANELRKAGYLSEAIALCREFLPKQPEHMSGFIVFGQALYESGDLSEARIVFEQALSLDPENLKALRHLGDIAKWDGDAAAARRWYERVLEADPRNDDIAAQLATLVTPVHVEPVVPDPEASKPTASAVFAPPTPLSPTPPVVTPPFSMVPIGLGAIPTPDAALRAMDFDEINARLREPAVLPIAHVKSPVSVSQAPVLPEEELLRLDAMEAVGAYAESETVVQTVADDLFCFGQTAAEEVAFQELPFEEGLMATEWPDTSALVARIGTPRPVTPLFVSAMTPDAVDAVGVESSDPLLAPTLDKAAFAELEGQFDRANEFAGQAAAEAADTDASGLVDAATPVDDGLESTAALAAELPEVVALFGDEIADIAASAYESDPVESSFADAMPPEYNPAFVTETMGELLVSQGFTARAVSVYEELVRRRPYDPVLTSRLAELQERLAADAAPVTPVFPTPAFVARVPPPFASPPFASPRFAEPLFATPMSAIAEEAAVFDGEPVARVTARERFARLATRRVPRRTPPRASVAVDAAAEGLASLFGGHAPMHDDLAARALGGAFAPLAELNPLGAELPFEEAMLGGAALTATPVRAATPIAMAEVPDGGGPFSFDRFFPDPATSPPPALAPNRTPTGEPAREVQPMTVSDDLAQFSEWLKGLGNP